MAPPKITITQTRLTQDARKPIWKWTCSAPGCGARLGGHGYRTRHDRAVEDGLAHLRTRHTLTLTAAAARWAA